MDARRRTDQHLGIVGLRRLDQFLGVLFFDQFARLQYADAVRHHAGKE